MNIRAYFNQYTGRFLDVKLKGRPEYVKMVFRTVWEDQASGSSKDPYISADIVPDGDEEHYLSKYSSEEVVIEKIILEEKQIEEIRPGRAIPGFTPLPEDDV